MLTHTSAGNYIQNIRETQASEQLESMELRQRGVNFEQKVDIVCPYFIYLLEINQVCEIMTDDKRDKMIDFLIN